MRVFFAIPLNDVWKDQLQELQANLLERAEKGRATPKANLHLTIQFIGEVVEIESLQLGASKLVLPEVYLEARGIASLKRGREELVYLDLNSSDALLRLHQNIRDMLKQQGVSFDSKRFKAHITLLRRVQWKEEVYLSQVEVDFPPYLAKELVLYESQLSQKGASYRRLKTYPLVRLDEMKK